MRWKSLLFFDNIFRQIVVTGLLLAAISAFYSVNSQVQNVAQATSTQSRSKAGMIYFPRLQMGKGWESSITLSNIDTRRVTSVISIFSADGIQKDVVMHDKHLPRERFRADMPMQYDAEVLSLTRLDPGQHITVKLESLPLDAAAIQVTSDGQVVGHITFRSADGTKSTDVPAVNEMLTTLDFPDLKGNDSKGKSISLFNPNEVESSLEVIALNQEKLEIGHHWLPSLASGESRTIIFDELFPGIPSEQLINVKVKSDAGLAGVQIPLPSENDWFSAAGFKEGQEFLSKMAVAAARPTSILSPVEGPLRVTSSNLGISDGRWEFNRHQSGLHRAQGGMGGSDDTNAWDINLYEPQNRNADVDKRVYAVAEGDVVPFAGVTLPNSCNAVLIAHPNKEAPEWWSGYLHMKSPTVQMNQRVYPNTEIGRVGRACANNDHLHFAVYTGQNKSGKLVSFNASITERGAGPAYDGYHDRADCSLIEGWAWDGKQPNTPVNVDIYDGGSKIMTVLAGIFRQDLLIAGKGNGYHGFSIATPDSLKDGRAHTIYVKYSGTSNNLNTTGKTVTCQSTRKAVMSSPSNSSTFTSSSVRFSWDAGSGVSRYWLYVGSAYSGYDIYAQNQGVNRSVTVNGIPTDGRTVYVRLWSEINGSWYYNDYNYRAFSGGGSGGSATALAQMLSPAPGSTFTSSTVTFNWSAGIGVGEYWLYLGTSPGASNLYNRSQGLNRSVTVYNLPVNGQPIYATLWSSTSTGWQYQIYTYRAR